MGAIGAAYQIEDTHFNVFVQEMTDGDNEPFPLIRPSWPTME